MTSETRTGSGKLRIDDARTWIGAFGRILDRGLGGGDVVVCAETEDDLVQYLER